MHFHYVTPRYKHVLALQGQWTDPVCTQARQVLAAEWGSPVCVQTTRVVVFTLGADALCADDQVPVWAMSHPVCVED